jgi:hypothetical protein
LIAIPALHTSVPAGRPISPRQRKVLHGLLHRDLRKCSKSALEGAYRLGWTLGPSSGHELSREGRRVADVSESAPADQPLVLP